MAQKMMLRFLTVLIVLVGWCFHPLPSFGRWKAAYANSSPTIQKWYSDQHNKRGEWCCDKSDGHPYYGDVKLLPDGGVLLDGNHKIPSYMVLTSPNPTGHAVWWYTGVRDYCFALPSMG